jgi:hypothetical protein
MTPASQRLDLAKLVGEVQLGCDIIYTENGKKAAAVARARSSLEL